MAVEQFGTVHEKKEFKSTIRKTEFLDLSSTAAVRILSNEYYSESTHYINRSTVKCLGDDCPICKTNKAIIMQDADGYRDDPRYSPKRTVYMVNVMDKSMAKVCTNCGTENRSSGQAMPCKKCSTILTSESQPLNKVKVLSRGVTLFDHLGAISNAVLDAQGEKIGMDRFDITLVVAGSGKDKTITPIPGQISDKIEYNQDDLFDLTKVVIELKPDEMLDLQRGVSLRDIFAARKAKTVNDDLPDFMKDDEDLSSANDAVNKLFNN